MESPGDGSPPAALHNYVVVLLFSSPARAEKTAYPQDSRMGWPLPTGRLLLVVVVAVVSMMLQHTTATTVTYGAGSSSLAKPGCPDKCGNVSIPYPFGVGEGCFMHDDFEVECDRDQARVSVGFYQSLVLEISLLRGEARVQSGRSVEWNCNYTKDNNWEKKFVWVSLGNFLKLSSKNKLTAIGCATVATIVGYTFADEDLIRSNDDPRMYTSACASFCNREDRVSSSAECNGMGCCQASVPQNLTTFRFAFVDTSVLTDTGGAPSTVWGNLSRNPQSFSPCSYAFVVEEDWFRFNPSYAKSKNFQSQDGRLPMVLDWSVGTETCGEVKKNTSSYACAARNSDCVPARSGQGYLCNCSQGYEGNPYLDGGCKDINECDYPSMYPCLNGICANKIGSYDCSCPPGTQSKDPKSTPCSHSPADSNQRQLKVVIGTSISSVFLVICISALMIKRQTRKLAKEKEKFFKQNGGHLLYQQILSKQIDTVTIFTTEDLKKATNNYDKSREIGVGGHGTVYKGILVNNRAVAVKRSKVMDVVQTEEFVQEIIILSQINHRNVVRLIGCCLEVEVPILVYEFIPNGTLFHLIHHDKNNKEPISAEVRLRIAQESAEALAYMHLSMNRPIVHGDVKSLNILLDENYMAKVTDFGASRLLPKDEAELMTMVQGTLGYLDPEYLQERILTEKSDVYSFGVVLLELITGKSAIYCEGPNKERKNLASSFLLAKRENKVEDILDTSIMAVGMEKLFQEVGELASLCLSFKGEERPSMTQVADKLKAIRSSWRRILLLKHEETQRLIIERSSGMDQQVGDLSPSMLYTAQMLRLDIETPHAR